MRLAVFDLDYTVWQPEMYQLWGPPQLVRASPKTSPHILREATTTTEGHVLEDRNGDTMRVFDGANYALTDINRLQNEGRDVRAAVASRTDEPRWAEICMTHLMLTDGSTLADCFGNRVEIGYGSKVGHLQRLQRQTGIAYADMCFFDNESSNIRDVQRAHPGVKCYYTPRGMTRQAWDQAKADFGMS